jgi:hypothetical protein
MKDNSIWRAVREGRAALGTGLKPGFNSVFQNIVLCQRVLDMR